LEYLKGRNHLGDIGIYGRTILIMILKKLGVKILTEFKLFKVEATAV
jgi:hypothetical protein